jgi:hypothetical protein
MAHGDQIPKAASDPWASLALAAGSFQNIVWDMPSFVRRARSPVPTYWSVGYATCLGMAFSAKNTRVRALSINCLPRSKRATCCERDLSARQRGPPRQPQQCKTKQWKKDITQKMTPAMPGAKLWAVIIW